MNESDLGKDTRSAEQIREDIEARRRRISSTVNEIDSRVHHALDWRGHASRHPLAAASIAAGLGATTGVLLRRPRRPPFDRVTDTVVQAVEDLRSRIDDRLAGTGERVRDRSRWGQPPRPAIPAALAATVAMATVDFFREKLSELRAERAARRYEERVAVDASSDDFGRPR